MRKIWKLLSLVLVCLAGRALSGVARVASEGDQQEAVKFARANDLLVARASARLFFEEEELCQ